MLSNHWSLEGGVGEAEIGLCEEFPRFSTSGPHKTATSKMLEIQFLHQLLGDEILPVWGGEKVVLLEKERHCLHIKIPF